MKHLRQCILKYSPASGIANAIRSSLKRETLFQVSRFLLFLFLEELSVRSLRECIKSLLFEMGIKDKSRLDF